MKFIRNWTTVGCLIFGLLAASLLTMAPPAVASDTPVAQTVYRVAQQTVRAQLFNWTGFYVGVQAGKNWTDVQAVGIPASFGADGWQYGARLGFDYQVPNTRIVAGILADINSASVKDSAVVGGINVPIDVDLSGSLRARVGYAFDGFLFYGTGGLSAQRLNVSAAGLNAETTNFGWVAGLGVETKLYKNLSIGLEYLYRGKMGDSICLTVGVCVPLQSDGQDVMLFANLRF